MLHLNCLNQTWFIISETESYWVAIQTENKSKNKVNKCELQYISYVQGTRGLSPRGKNGEQVMKHNSQFFKLLLACFLV